MTFEMRPISKFFLPPPQKKRTSHDHLSMIYRAYNQKDFIANFENWPRINDVFLGTVCVVYDIVNTSCFCVYETNAKKTIKIFILNKFLDEIRADSARDTVCAQQNLIAVLDISNNLLAF